MNDLAKSHQSTVRLVDWDADSLSSFLRGQNASELRTDLITRAALYANDALVAFRSAVDVLSITDKHAHERYSKTLQSLASAVEEISERL